jgi:PBSX family phage terminase large subunit
MKSLDRKPPPVEEREILFHKTKDQIKACDVLNKHKHTMLYGGSRSGKTTIAVRNVILRAHKTSSRHLLCRFRFNHAKTSLWHDTIPKVLKLCFDSGKYKPKFDKSDWYVEFKVGFNQTSQIWLGGVDDKERVEKILGNEYSTIYGNECSQIAYGAITTLRTRLAEKTILKNKFYYDCNPPSKKHWSYQEFIEGKIPLTHDKSNLDSGHLLLNPHGNVANLPEDYILELENLPKREKDRFLLGKFLADSDGALWTNEVISWARNKPYGKAVKTIISVDPSTTSNKGSDECGIIVCSMDENKEGIVEGDYTLKASPAKWAKVAVDAYVEHEANCIVAESNQGGEMVKEVLQNYAKANDIHCPKIILVHASKGKVARAEPVSVLYEHGKISHTRSFLYLEDELTETVFDAESLKQSPNRLDALVWGFTYLFKLGKKVHIG